jgi:branched-chain amino acid transport system permease protein
MEFITQSVVIGVAYDAPLVLAAIGFALLYRLTGLINVAYAETLTLGAYFAMWLNTTFGLDFYAVLIPTAILSGLLSVATYLVIFRPAKKRNVGGLEMIIISFGLAVFLRHGLQFIFGSPVRFFDVPPPDTVSILGVGVTSFRLVAVFTVALVSLLLYLFIQRSQFGLQIRALASDEQLAQVSGIRPLVVPAHSSASARRSIRCWAGTSSSSSCSWCSWVEPGVSAASSSWEWRPASP